MNFLAIHRCNWSYSKPVTPMHVGGYVLKIACKVSLIFSIQLTHTLERAWSLEKYSRVIHIPVNMGSEGSQNANMVGAAWVAVEKSTGIRKRTWDSEHAGHYDLCSTKRMPKNRLSCSDLFCWNRCNREFSQLMSGAAGGGRWGQMWQITGCVSICVVRLVWAHCTASGEELG